MSEQTGRGAVFIQNPVEEKSENFRDVYANFSRISMSPWDMGIVFGTLRDTVAGQPTTINSEVLVRMSPQQFKVFVRSLPVIMAEWEARFGEVNIASQFMATPDAIHASMAEAERQAARNMQTDTASRAPKQRKKNP